jgi:hypothetical protein
MNEQRGYLHGTITSCLLVRCEAGTVYCMVMCGNRFTYDRSVRAHEVFGLKKNRPLMIIVLCITPLRSLGPIEYLLVYLGVGYTGRNFQK